MGVTKDQFLAVKPKLLSIDLPDLGIIVNVLKGTLATFRAVQNGNKEQVVEQLALILADDEGHLLFTDPEDIKKLESMITLSDANFIMDKWSELNGVTKQQIEEATKNSQASTRSDSATV